jgi:hypothetical protein
MKIVLNRLREESTFDCSYFNPRFYFETEWCLDMHGYIDREELNFRLQEINRLVAANPLLSERTKKALLYGFVVLSIILITFIGLAATILKGDGGNFVTPTVMQALVAIVFYVGKYFINEEAKRRTERFSEAIKRLFDQYNLRDNPTANWKLKWRHVLSHYKVEMNYSFDNNNGAKSKGKITPMYAEEAEIELEINDALAEITECTIRLHLYRTNKLRRITRQQEELERLLASNEDVSVTIEEKMLPNVPYHDYTPSNNTPLPNNIPPPNINKTEMPIHFVENANNRRKNNTYDNGNERINYPSPQTQTFTSVNPQVQMVTSVNPQVQTLTSAYDP